jgi:SWI/SNF-related matrix-associated actin-dependent regulator 1 of chromatin subfamily A
MLQVALDHLDIRYTRLDGSTKTDERQALVDEFNEDEDITVFLLSTKAGGVGINLTAASVVVIYDQDFNPHNDRQAADRAYRIGQEREVEVIKLITKDSIDEDMLNIGMTKLRLDDAVGGGEESTAPTTAGGAPTLSGEAGQKDDQTAKEMKKSLLTTLRNKFVEGNGEDVNGHDAEEDDGEDDSMGVKLEASQSKEVRKARGTQVPKEE